MRLGPRAWLLGPPAVPPAEAGIGEVVGVAVAAGAGGVGAGLRAEGVGEAGTEAGAGLRAGVKVGAEVERGRDAGVGAEVEAGAGARAEVGTGVEMRGEIDPGAEARAGYPSLRFPLGNAAKCRWEGILPFAAADMAPLIRPFGHEAFGQLIGSQARCAVPLAA